MSRSLSLLLLSAASICFGARCGLPQGSAPSALVIRVSDQAGAPIPAATVRAVPVGTGPATLLASDQNGLASLSLAAATQKYELTVSAQGFVQQSKTFIATRDPLNTIDFHLAVGGGGPNVFVNGDDGLPAPNDLISPSRPIVSGLAPGMKIKLVSARGTEKTYAVIFNKGDEVLSGLTDFAVENHVADAHFTGIGAVSRAVVGWLDPEAKQYRAIPVDEQVEVLSMIGDVATFNQRPVVHAHMVFGRHDGTTVGGHLWEAHVSPTLEVFVTVNAAPLKKKADDASGMKLIGPALD